MLPSATPFFQVWIRGLLCEVTGYIEPADRSVGIMADSFIVEYVRALDGRVIQDLSESEQFLLDEAYWDSPPITDNDLNVFDYREFCDSPAGEIEFEETHIQWLRYWSLNIPATGNCITDGTMSDAWLNGRPYQNVSKGDRVNIRAHSSGFGQGLTYPTMTATMLEDSITGTWDVADVQADDGKEYSVYGFSITPAH